MKAGTTERHRMYRDVGVRVRRLRLARAFSQDHLAALAGLTAAMISHVECGRAVPSPDSLRKIALALGVSPMELMEESQKVAS